MKTIYDIAKAELQSLFYSPIAWLILIIFSFQASMTFCGLLGYMVRSASLGHGGYNLTMGLFGGPNSLFSSVQDYLYLYIPLLTMNLMSRELGSGSIKLLYSSPITNVQIILGKYFSMVIFGLALISILVIYSVCGALVIQNADVSLILSGLLGTYLLICAYAAIGLFMSSVTSYQVIAAVGTLAILAALTYVKGLWQDVDFVRDLTFWLAITGRAQTFVGGLICSEDFFYYLIVIGLFLSLTIIRLASRRQKNSKIMIWGKYVGIWAVALFLGYLSSSPMFMSFADVTTTKQNTLTTNSQEIIKKMDGGLTITTYANILDQNNSFFVAPGMRNYDKGVFAQYVRFKPEIDMKYVYYYDKADTTNWASFYPGMNLEEIARKVVKAGDLDSTKILTPEQIRKIIDLSPEGNRVVRLLERENGQKTFLRMYNDMMRQPGETEISAAFKRLVMTLPKVGFLTGHGERNTSSRGERDYSTFTHEKPSRSSLINQGFDFETVTLEEEIPSDISILVIAEARYPLADEEKSYLDQYVAKGGNLLIIGEAGRQEVMNPLVAPFGVSFEAGCLVNLSGNNLADLTLSNVAKEGENVAYKFGWMRRNELVVMMPTATGLSYTTDKGFDVVRLFETDSTCWNELETTNFVDDTARINPVIGEVQKKHVTGLALSRNVGEKEQRILILGDADCMSNLGLSTRRQGIRDYNFGVIEGGFFWLSNGEVPIDVRRPSPTDNKVLLGDVGMTRVKYAFMGGIPIVLLCMILLIWFRRRGR